MTGNYAVWRNKNFVMVYVKKKKKVGFQDSLHKIAMTILYSELFFPHVFWDNFMKGGKQIWFECQIKIPKKSDLTTVNNIINLIVCEHTIQQSEELNPLYIGHTVTDGL
jgi:hypothetical protein